MVSGPELEFQPGHIIFPSLWTHCRSMLELRAAMGLSYWFGADSGKKHVTGRSCGSVIRDCSDIK